MIPSHGTDLAEHLALFRRRRLLFLACVLLGGLGSALALQLVPPAYTATTQVLVSPSGIQEQNNQVTARQREALNLDTEAQIAQSAVVAAKAAELAGTTTLARPEVTVPPNSAILSIAVTGPDPALAAAHARAYAKAYLAHRKENAQDALDAQLKALYTKIKQVNASLTEVVAGLTKLTRGSAERTLALHRQTVLSRQATVLTTRYDALKTVAVTPGTVISPAEPPAAPSRPSPPLYLGTGLMAGLLAGTGLAHLRDRLDTRLRTAADVERLTGLAVLADLSAPAPDPHEPASSLIASCRGERLLVRAVPREPVEQPVLPFALPFALLDGSSVHDLGLADAAVLLVTLRRATATDVAAAARHLRRHEVPVVGVITRSAAKTPAAPRPSGHPGETAPIPVVTDQA
ncbi:Wzz/FepE/Etk N-terminal domain-containing protein [Nonomuraea sp. NPDC050328]|uniref:Wzz/FepE/Etk N-terminal domain-containing protein n=1 Tax=Nonomuraea sp. NPDC050328 TaxID=3364361 RepID=UPI0037A567CC